MALADEELAQVRKRVLAGGAERYHEANAAKGKLFARERIALLVDEGSFVEDGAATPTCWPTGCPPTAWSPAAATHRRPPGLPDGQRLHGQGRLLGRPHGREDHPDHRAGVRRPAYRWSTWSTRPAPASPTRSTCSPAGAAPATSSTTRSAPPARSRRCARCSARRAAGGAYIPAFCDVVAMVDGNASMYLGSDRMVEMVTGEKTTLEAMGGARVHCAESGVGHFLCKTEDEALDVVRRYLSYLPSNWQGQPPPVARPRRRRPGRPGRAGAGQRAAGLRHARASSRACSTTGSFFEIQALWARELTVGFGRLDGEVVGVVGNNSMFKGGVLFVDSADKATRFVQLCDAFNVPLLFLSDVPGFMVGTAVEKQGIIRHGAKMITAISEATVPKICVVVRKAYGAGLYAMAGPGLRAGRDDRAAHREDRRDGRGGGGQRGLRQQDRRHRRRGRARGVRRRQARRVRARHRHHAAGQRARRRHRSSSRPTCAPS